MAIKMVRKLNEESGAILAIVIILMFAVSITGLAFLNSTVMEYRLATREVHKNQAFYLAEGGIKHLLVKLRAEEDKPQIDWTYLGDGDYMVFASYDASPSYAISTGRIIKKGHEILKRIKVVIDWQSVFKYGVFGEEKVLLQGTPEVSSYRSDEPFNPAANAQIGTNSIDEAAIELQGNAEVKGDVFSGEGSNPDLAISAEPGAVTGNRGALDDYVALPDVIVPEGLPFMGSLSVAGGGVESISADAEYSSITVQGSLTISSSGDLVVGNLRILGSGKIIIPSGISVTVYVIGPEKAFLGGKAIENVDEDPTRFRIYGAGDCPEIELAGTTKFYGAVYAPGIPVTCTGTGDIYGALIGRTVTLPGTARVYCDEILAGTPGGPEFVSFTDWQEIS